MLEEGLLSNHSQCMIMQGEVRAAAAHTSTDMQERQGVCIGLSEIIQHTSRDYMQMYADSLLPTIAMHSVIRREK